MRVTYHLNVLSPLEEWSKLQVCHWFGISMQGMSAAEICQLAEFYESEVESVKYAKRARQIGTDDCERSDRPTDTPGKMVGVETQFSKTILAISELQQGSCLAWNVCRHRTGVRISQGVWAMFRKDYRNTRSLNDGLHPHFCNSKPFAATNSSNAI